MPRKLWGELIDDNQPSGSENFIPVGAKKAKLDEVQNDEPKEAKKNVTVKIKNPLVTQTIEVMKQTEMLQSLIDTYSNKSGSSNQLLIPGQMIPEVNFPPENVADFVNDDKFAKPFWFIPPHDTSFARGVPQSYPQINAEVCRASIRKAACGQLRVAGFTDTTESALVLFTDSIEEFVRSFMQQLQEIHSNDPLKETQPDVEITTLEKAYFSLTNSSLTSVHNYFKHNIIARNRAEISEFNGVLQEYDKLMKESQAAPKQEYPDGDFLSIFEMPQSNESIGGVPGGGQMLTILGGQSHMTVQTPDGAMTSMHIQPSTEAGLNPYVNDVQLQVHD